MIIGRPRAAEPETAYFIRVMGQSNALGYATHERLANPLNYYGISTGYPAIIGGQPAYTATPPDVFIYNKPTALAWDSEYVDDGSWQPYVAGVNSAKNNPYTGVELSLATRIQEYSGKKVYIIKPCFANTNLQFYFTYTQEPGAWLYTNIHIAMEHHTRMAMNAFRLANPNVRAVPLVDYWGQGENDAGQDRTAGQYFNDFVTMYNYRNKFDKANFNLPDNRRILTVIPTLKFTLLANEGVINTSYNDLAAAYPGDIKVLNTGLLPRKNDLTTAERLPSNGGLSDNTHMSLYALLGLGELAFSEVVTRGVIQPL